MLLLALSMSACRTPVVRQVTGTVTVTPLFGPVIGAEVIGGRGDDGDVVVLLAGGVDLVRVDLAGRTSTRTHLRLSAGESCWGLARLSSGALWTLNGRHALVRVTEDGKVVERIVLATPHFGVFAAGNRLVFQEAVFVAPRAALTIASQPGGPRAAWSGIATRAFDGLARASAAALNMLACGATRTRERACWFPDEAVLFLLDDSGTTRRVPLVGLRTVPPEVLLTTDNPPRAVRDAYVGGTGDLWILSSGEPPPGQAGTPGGWVVAHYGANGEPRGQARLPEAARLILDADGRRVRVLLSSGYVAEVRAW